MHPQTNCRLRWEALKARGDFTVAEIVAIDNDTPWSEVEPRWWIEMIEEKQRLLAKQALDEMARISQEHNLY